MLDTLADQVLDTVSTKRATFGHANLLAETHRQLHGLHFASGSDRLETAEHITTTALSQALLLNPPDPARPELRLHKGADIYSTQQIFDAETRLLDAGRDTTAPALPHPTTDTTTSSPEDAALSSDQAAAVTEVATSGRRLDVLVGSAGTGKTTSLKDLRKQWEGYYGAGSVVGLAPSAAAAEVLGTQLGIATENTSKWLIEHARTPDRIATISRLQAQIDSSSSLGTARARRLTRQRDAAQTERDKWALRPGQLLIIDEASLAPTLHLDTITTHATAAGAKVLLVGDPMQLGPVDAGGAFSMLTHDRDDIAELTTPRRFTEPWEAAATLQLRAGDPDVIQTYVDHDRIHDGTTDEVMAGVLERWANDTAAGLDSLMIAADHATVTDLNRAARTQLISTGDVSADGVAIAHGAAGIGDRIVTRHNDRALRHGDRSQDWVRNGDTWTITNTRPDGSLTAENAAGSTVELDVDYVQSHVELGYATTAHQTQGRTVDTTHTIINSTTTREALYVAATRGRNSNTLHIALDHDRDPDTSHGANGDEPSAAEVLQKVIRASGTDTSAHAALTQHQTPTPQQQPPTSIRRIEPTSPHLPSF